MKYGFQALALVMGNAIVNFGGALVNAFQLWSSTMEQETFWNNVFRTFIANYWVKGDLLGTAFLLLCMVASVIWTMTMVNLATAIAKKLTG